MLDKGHAGPVGILELGVLGKVVIGGGGGHAVRPARQRLEQHQLSRHVFADQIQRQQRVAQVVEHAHEDHQVEAFAQGGHVINAGLAELDPVHVQHLRRKAGLRQIAGVGVDPQDAGGPPPAHLEAVEARVAADVQNGLAGQIRGHQMREAGELVGGIIAQEMPGRSADAAKVEVLEPRAKPFGLLGDLRCVHRPSASRFH